MAAHTYVPLPSAVANGTAFDAEPGALCFGGLEWACAVCAEQHAHHENLDAMREMMTNEEKTKRIDALQAEIDKLRKEQTAVSAEHITTFHCPNCGDEFDIVYCVQLESL